jgi:hypothetical protein
VCSSDLKELNALRGLSAIRVSARLGGRTSVFQLWDLHNENFSQNLEPMHPKDAVAG